MPGQKMAVVKVKTIVLENQPRRHGPCPPATASAEGRQLNGAPSPPLRGRRGASLTAPLPLYSCASCESMTATSKIRPDAPGQQPFFARSESLRRHDIF